MFTNKKRDYAHCPWCKTRRSLSTAWTGQDKTEMNRLFVVGRREGRRHRGILGGPAVVAELLEAPLLGSSPLHRLAVRGPRQVLLHLRLHCERHLHGGGPSRHHTRPASPPQRGS